MATTWAPMPELKDLVELLKNAFPKKLEHVQIDRILYTSFSKKNSNCFGRIGPIPARFAIVVNDYDYMLEIHKESWALLDEGKRLYIVLHELTHIPPEGFNKESKYYKRTIKHDLEDFRHLVKEYGVEMENSEQLVNMVENPQPVKKTVINSDGNVGINTSTPSEEANATNEPDTQDNEPNEEEKE